MAVCLRAEDLQRALHTSQSGLFLGVVLGCTPHLSFSGAVSFPFEAIEGMYTIDISPMVYMPYGIHALYRQPGIPWLPIEVHAVLTLHIHESFIPRGVFTPSRQGGISCLAGTISYTYTETGDISRLAGT